ncbi:hypothetical protein QA600_07825 [Natronococcus sp. A-GB1]|uniref:hypothetical protein n=1 Tax=Natronococcus sp. A-GB1 TaxID=3037648 RepID=UPI00241F52EC|nr:hypothetical protein [Natronococcus sp. A-GB1]MDG5759247.1 hypothetical protein [Natronococcus sp. A-GB1]
MSVSAEYTTRGAFDDQQVVTVEVAKPTDSEFPALGTELHGRLAAEMDQSIMLEAPFGDY